MYKYPDGSIEYKWPDEFTDILVNGQSVLNLNPISVRVRKSGYGFVLCEKTDPTDTVNVLIDGQTQNFIVKGMVTVVP